MSDETTPGPDLREQIADALRAAAVNLNYAPEGLADAVMAAVRSEFDRRDAEIAELKATIDRVRRMAQVWIDIRPEYPTATREGHGIAYAGEQIIAAIDQPADSKEG